MRCMDRLIKYEKYDMDLLMVLIKNGTIKCGRYSQLVKIKKDKEMKGKEFFKNGSSNSKE